MEPSAETLLRHADFLKNLARRLLDGSGDLAEDAVQDTMVAALERPPRDERNVRGWLATVTANFARMRRRAETRRRAREFAVARREATSDTALAAERLEIERKVVAAAHALPEPYRSTIVLRFFEGLSPREIARRQDIPAETVRTRIKRALRRLREDLDTSHDGQRGTWQRALAPIAWSLTKPAGLAVAGALLMSTRVKVVVLLLLLGGGAYGVHRAMRSSDPLRRGDHAETKHSPGKQTDGDTSDRATRTPPERGKTKSRGPGTETATNPPAKLGPGNIAVRVYADQRPLPNARVFVPNLAVENDKSFRTDANGRFSMEARGKQSMAFWHPDFGPVRRTVEADGREVRIDLPAGQTVTVNVVAGPDARPVAGARVLLLQAGAGLLRGNNARTARDEELDPVRLMPVMTTDDFMARSDASHLFEHGTATTDASGRARFSGLPEGTADIIVLADGYLPGRARNASIGKRDVVVRLAQGGSVEVRAPLVANKPGAGLVCEIIRPGLMPLPVALTQLDDDGHAILATVPSGRFVLTLSKGGTSPLSSSMGARSEQNPALAMRTIDVREGERVVVEIGESAPRCNLRGTVRAKDAAGCDVLLIPAGRSEAQYQQGKADDRGAFVFADLAPGRYIVAARLKSGAQLSRTIELSERDTDVELVAGPSGLFGQVLGVDKKPVARAKILLMRRSLQDAGAPVRHGILSMQRELVAQTDIRDGGTYRINGIDPGKYRLVVGVGRRMVEVAGGSRRHDVSLADVKTHELTVTASGQGAGLCLGA